MTLTEVIDGISFLVASRYLQLNPPETTFLIVGEASTWVENDLIIIIITTAATFLRRRVTIVTWMQRSASIAGALAASHCQLLHDC